MSSAIEYARQQWRERVGGEPPLITNADTMLAEIARRLSEPAPEFGSAQRLANEAEIERNRRARESGPQMSHAEADDVSRPLASSASPLS